MMSPSNDHLGLLLAGGQSRRFGSPKAFAILDGVPLARRALATLLEAGLEAVVADRDGDVATRLGVRGIADHYPGAGPLAGIHAGLALAAEEGRRGVLCLPLDAPFASASLMRELLALTAEGAAAVVPESRGPLGFEPLFAWYSVQLLDVVTAALETGRRAPHRLLTDLPGLAILPLDRVERHGDADRIFLNVNTPADLARATHLNGSDDG